MKMNITTNHTQKNTKRKNDISICKGRRQLWESSGFINLVTELYGWQ